MAMKKSNNIRFIISTIRKLTSVGESKIPVQKGIVDIDISTEAITLNDIDLNFRFNNK